MGGHKPPFYSQAVRWLCWVPPFVHRAPQLKGGLPPDLWTSVLPLPEAGVQSTGWDMGREKLVCAWEQWPSRPGRVKLGTGSAQGSWESLLGSSGSSATWPALNTGEWSLPLQAGGPIWSELSFCCF